VSVPDLSPAALRAHAATLRTPLAELPGSVVANLRWCAGLLEAIAARDSARASSLHPLALAVPFGDKSILPIAERLEAIADRDEQRIRDESRALVAEPGALRVAADALVSHIATTRADVGARTHALAGDLRAALAESPAPVAPAPLSGGQAFRVDFEARAYAVVQAAHKVMREEPYPTATGSLADLERAVNRFEAVPPPAPAPAQAPTACAFTHDGLACRLDDGHREPHLNVRGDRFNFVRWAPPPGPPPPTVREPDTYWKPYDTSEPEAPPFGEHLRALREAKGLGLREAAEKLGVSATYVSRIETGKEPTPTEERIRGMAELYGVDFDALMLAAGRVSQADIEAVMLAKREKRWPLTQSKPWTLGEPEAPRRTVRERWYDHAARQDVPVTMGRDVSVLLDVLDGLDAGADAKEVDRG
jgi:transcriptional regulator with XRE-family HTH domain